jgi:hypothetical protein
MTSPPNFLCIFSPSALDTRIVERNAVFQEFGALGLGNPFPAFGVEKDLDVWALATMKELSKATWAGGPV